MTQPFSRLVIDYGGMQIHDARHDLRVVLIGQPPPGLRSCLLAQGFRRLPDDPTIYSRAASPDAIFNVQVIGRHFFPTTERDS